MHDKVWIGHKPPTIEGFVGTESLMVLTQFRDIDELAIPAVLPGGESGSSVVALLEGDGAHFDTLIVYGSDSQQVSSVMDSASEAGLADHYLISYDDGLTIKNSD